MEALGGRAGVIDQGGFDPFGGGDGECAGDDAGAHAGEEVAEGRQGSGVGIRKGGFDGVEG